MDPSRRGLLSGLAAAPAAIAGVTAATEAEARARTLGMTQWGPSIVVEYPLEYTDQIYATQRCNLWCWAASLEMLFRIHGLNLSQESIVRQTYGSLVCRTATWDNLLTSTNRVWDLDGGGRARTRFAAGYDYHHQIYTLSNEGVIAALANNVPLIYCNRTHMMLLIAMEYIATAQGPYVTKMGFFDPWPTPTPGTQSPRRGARGALAKELVPANLGGDMTFLSRVEFYRA